MSLKKDYIHHKALQHGPGGIACPCCNSYNCHPRNMKKLARRLARRNDKQALKEQI